MSAQGGSAVVEVIDGDRAVATVHLAPTAHPDLGTVDVLARLLLAVRRVGWTMRLRDPCPELTELLEVAGLTDVVGGSR